MKQAIEKAIEGGWRTKVTVNGIKMTSGNWEAQLMVAGEFASVWFLDPLFWQALGKALGWSGYDYFIQKKLGMERQVKTPIWQWHWYRFIDHLAEGKDADEFFNNLIN